MDIDFEKLQKQAEQLTYAIAYGVYSLILVCVGILALYGVLCIIF